MNERKWTPGPWRAKSVVVENGEWMGVAVQSDSDVELLWFENDPEPDDANAHLISAAPDLYDALQAMVDYCNAECGSKIYPGHQANQALAKARGETQ